MLEPPVKSRADLDKVQFLPAVTQDGYLGELEVVQQLVGEDGLRRGAATQGTDQFLVDAVGVEGSLLLYYDDREMLEELIRMFNSYPRRSCGWHWRPAPNDLRRLVQLLYECRLVAQQYAELFLPHIRANVELTHRYGALYHYYDDGKMDKTLEYLAEAGVDVVETLSPPPMGDVDLASAKARIGDRVCLKGERGSGQRHLARHEGKRFEKRCAGRSRSALRAAASSGHIRLHPARNALGQCGDLLRRSPRIRPHAYV